MEKQDIYILSRAQKVINKIENKIDVELISDYSLDLNKSTHTYFVRNFERTISNKATEQNKKVFYSDLLCNSAGQVPEHKRLYFIAENEFEICERLNVIILFQS